METKDAIYFFGATGYYGFMSNFFYCDIIDPLSGLTFPTSEHYFMYYKCMQFDSTNQEVLQEIAAAKSPKAVKQLGRKVKNFNEEEWDRVRYDVMKAGLILKFQQNDEIRRRLINSGNKVLYEASPYDRIWGIGFGPAEAPSKPQDRYGRNLLGICLMEIRAMLISGA